MDNYRFVTTWTKLRAIWAILRDGTVIWNVAFTGSFHAESSGPGEISFYKDVTVDGKPLTLRHLVPRS